MNIILFILAGVVGFAIGRKSVKSFKFSDEDLKRMREKAHESLGDRTEERKIRILEMMKEEIVRQNQLDGCNIKNGKKGIIRKDVEKRLGVSETTALKYLNQLEKEGKIRQVGEAGKRAYYELIK